MQYLGTFESEEAAAQAYDYAAVYHRGSKAVTNFDVRNYIDMVTGGLGATEGTCSCVVLPHSVGFRGCWHSLWRCSERCCCVPCVHVRGRVAVRAVFSVSCYAVHFPAVRSRTMRSRAGQISMRSSVVRCRTAFPVN